MRIEKLIIQNLNSIEDAEIVFSEGILAKEPIFLICGETGSGKTTILDAITLALYNRSSRYDKVRNREMTEYGIKTNNVLNVLRNGKKDGKSELHFSVKEDHYIATWLVHKTKSDAYSGDRRRLEKVEDGVRVVLSNKIEDVNMRIEDLVGLTYEQFIRSVMLAQGEFNTFLVSGKSEQSEILEMLTGTEVYSRIAESVKEKKETAKTERKIAEDLYNSLDDKLLPQEKCAELAAAKEELQRVLSQNECELKVVESSIAWLKKDAVLRKECDDAKLLYDRVLERVDSDEYKSNQAIIDDYHKTVDVRESLGEQRRLERELQDVAKNYDNNVRLFLNLRESLQEEKYNRERMLLSLDDLKNWIENHKDSELVFNNQNLIFGILKEMRELTKSLASKENELKDYGLKKKHIELQLQSLSLDFENAKKSKQEAECFLEKLLFNFDSGRYTALLDDRQKLDAERKSYFDRNAKLNTVRTLLEQYLDLGKNIENDKFKYENLKLLFNENNDVLLQSKIAFENKDKEFQEQKEMVEEWAKEIRRKLKNGDSCPVCGSTEHRYKDEEIVQSLFESVRKEWQNLKDSYEKAKDVLNEIKAKLDATSDNINKEEARLQALLNNLNAQCNGKVIFDIERLDSNIKKYNDLIQNINKRILDVDAELNNIIVIKESIDKAQENKRVADEKYNLADSNLSNKKHEYQRLELSMSTVEAVVKEQKSNLQEDETRFGEYVRIENWKHLFLNSFDTLVKILKDIASEWQTKNDMLKNTENQIVNISEVIEKCETYVLITLPLINNCNLHFDRCKVRLHDLLPSFSAICENIKERVSEKSRREERLSHIKSTIVDFIANNEDITFERLERLFEISDIQYFERKNSAVKDDIIKSETTLKIKTESLNAHQNDEYKPNGDIALEELESRFVELINEKKINDENLSGVIMQLEINERNISDFLEYQKDFNEKDRVYNMWDQLAKTIGTTKENNFRDVAQAYTMGILLDRANYYMTQLSTRYKLTNYTDSLAIMVQDMEMGGELRTASSLSGGETFLVSLALALGLTSLNDVHFNTDMIFIDEGFGTLDNESLDMVMNTLENLHNLGKRVGIISHVDALKERIPAKIQLVREGKSASRVEIVRN